MKKLYIARHAKSDWGQEGYSDFDRPLNDKGLRDGEAMAKYLSSLEVTVDSIVSSSAKRALTTAKFYADTILTAGDLVEMDVIYEAEERDMMQIIKQASNEVNSLMLVGHNPTFSLLVNLLTGQPVDMSAGSIAELNIDLESWKDVAMNSAQLVQMLSPKNMPY